MYRVLLIDHHDSFVYNILQILRESGLCQPRVVPIEALTSSMIQSSDRVILSPGPGLPEDFPDLIPLIRYWAPTKAILGICLGHQAIGQAFGGVLQAAHPIRHGFQDDLVILKNNEALFRDLGQEIRIGRYHSWVVDKDSLPADFELTATNPEGLVMAMQHTRYKLTGIQFHPESYMTPLGGRMLSNWLRDPSH